MMGQDTPTPFYQRDGITIYVGDNSEILPRLDTESVSAVVSDPPSGISFMNANWDSHKGGRNQWIAWLASVLSECKRVMLPGAHALIWALPRTSGWTSMAIEDAGLDVRDCITHLFGSGFPKSHNVGNGWGTALKPAAEFWYLARKPFTGTVAANVLQHGTGAINVDASRIHGEGAEAGRRRHGGGIPGNGTSYELPDSHGEQPAGRWPSNVILDEGSARELDRQSGERKSGGKVLGTEPSKTGNNGIYGTYQRVENAPYFDTGGASRFFYVAKASRAERNRGLPEGETSSHPTVKPLALMRYLIQMVTPPGGIVLDPFMGSGSTLVAAAMLGFHAIGIELSEEYAEIAARRVDHALNERARRLPGLEEVS